ncbi:hypothetical protein AB0H20_32270 [Nocardia fluminea]|jgi:hypothetical protein|uniref:hypothetical protein n=1 Tax=Nocardia fluminea TaxID=134984 RepID=UPI0033D73202
MGYPYGQQQGQGYPPAGQQGYNPYGQAAPGYGAPGPGVPGYGAPMSGYGPPGYATPGPGAPGYGYPPPAASGATGIIAAVLALLLSMVSLGGAVVSYNTTSAYECSGGLVQKSDGTFGCSSTSISPLVMTFVVIGAALGLLLLIGSLLLFLRKTAGRVIVISVAALSALGSLGSLATSASSSVISGASTAIGLVQAAVSVLMLSLAAASSTGRWIRAAQQRPNYPQGGYQRY